MTRIGAPALHLQPDLAHLPFGGAWWPRSDDPTPGLLDLLDVWPADRVPVTGYAYLPVDWDVGHAGAPGVDILEGEAALPQLRTRTLVLRLADRTACRVLVIPYGAPRDIAERLLVEATAPESRWRRADFDHAFAALVPRQSRLLRENGSDA